MPRLHPYCSLLITAVLTAGVTTAASLFTFGWWNSTWSPAAGTTCTSIVANAGCVEFGRHTVTVGGGMFALGFPTRYSPNPPRVLPSWDSSTAGAPGFISHTLRIPIWLFAAPVLAFQLYRARRTHTAHGHCRSCNYDVSTIATPQCPECGTEI